MTTTAQKVKGEIRPSDAQQVVETARKLLAEPDVYEHTEALRSDVARAQENAGYNGWSNYETWAMALWIDNDQGSYEESRRLVKEAQSNVGLHRTPEGAGADALKDWMEEAIPDLEASVWSDLLTAAFQQVDWYEIAANYIEEVQNES